MNSPIYSSIKMMAKWFHDAMKVTKRIDAFVVPSEFTMGKLLEYGIPKEKLHHIPTFFNLKEADPSVQYQPFFLFVGRIEKQKGLMSVVIGVYAPTMIAWLIGRKAPKGVKMCLGMF